MNKLTFLIAMNCLALAGVSASLLGPIINDDGFVSDLKTNLENKKAALVSYFKPSPNDLNLKVINPPPALLEEKLDKPPEDPLNLSPQYDLLSEKKNNPVVVKEKPIQSSGDDIFEKITNSSTAKKSTSISAVVKDENPYVDPTSVEEKTEPVVTKENKADTLTKNVALSADDNATKNPILDEIPLPASRLIELPNISIVEVEALIDDIVFELKMNEGFNVVPISLSTSVPEVEEVIFYSAIQRKLEENVYENMYFGYMKRPRRTPQLNVYSTKSVDGEILPNTLNTNMFIGDLIKKVSTKTLEYESSLSVKDLDFKLINLSYVDPDGALFGLKAMGFSVITDSAALWADNSFRGKLGLPLTAEEKKNNEMDSAPKKNTSSNSDDVFDKLNKTNTTKSSNNLYSDSASDNVEDDTEQSNAIEYLPSAIKASRLPMIVKMPSPDAKSTGLVGGNTLNKYLSQQSSTTSTTDTYTDSTTTPTSSQLTTPPTADLPVPLAGQVSSQLLVIYNPNDQKALLRVNKAISELIDRPAKQILIEGIVLEIASSELSKLGVNWSTTRTNGSIISLGTLAEITSVAAGSAAASVAYTTAGGTGAGPSFAANLEALITKTKSQVLSKPSLMTLDNRQASIKVGTNIPIAASVTTAVGASTAGFTYLPVGIMLNIRPRISDDNQEISMLIDATISQKVDDEDVIIYNSTGVAMASAPTTTLRKIQTYARVNNESPLIIAGLVSKQKTMTTTGVPVLSSIPLLGGLFSFESPSNVDTEVVLIITPTIIEAEDNTIKLGNFDKDFTDSEDLFKNNYRITNKDTSGVKSILSNNIFKAFQAKLDILRSEKPSKFEVEPFNGWAEGKIPGEESFIAGKIGEIEKRIDLADDIKSEQIKFTRKNTRNILEKISLDSLLAYYGENENNFFVANPGKALLIAFDGYQSPDGNLLDSIVPEISMVDCKDRKDWKRLLWETNFDNGHMKKTLVIHSPEDVELLKRAIATNLIINNNGGLDQLSIKHFKEGRPIRLPDNLSETPVNIDYNTAYYFANTEFFINNFYNKLDDQLKIIDFALDER